MKKFKMVSKGVMGVIIFGFVAILLGCILVNIIAEQTQKSTTLTTATETINIAGARAYPSINDDINSSFKFHLAYGCQESTSWKHDVTGTCQNIALITNATGAALTESTDFLDNDTNSVCTGQSAGDLTFINSSTMITSLSSGLNTTQVTYGYCDSGFVNVGWGRTILNLVPGFYVLGILGVAIVIVYVLMNQGLLGQQEEE